MAPSTIRPNAAGRLHIAAPPIPRSTQNTSRNPSMTAELCCCESQFNNLPIGAEASWLK